MDTTELDLAYLQLVATAEAVAVESPLPLWARVTVDRTLGQVALQGRELAGAGRDVLTGHPAEVDLWPVTAVLPPVFAALTSAQRLGLVCRNALDLVTVVGTIPENAADSPVRLCPVDEHGERSSTGMVLSWREMITLYAAEDLPSRTARLATVAPVG